jgi:periplasmic protein TonB
MKIFLRALTVPTRFLKREITCLSAVSFYHSTSLWLKKNYSFPFLSIMDYFNKSKWNKNVGLRYLLGLTASLSFTLTAFEWKSYESQAPIMLACIKEQTMDIPDNYCPPPPPPVLVQPEIIETFDEEDAESILLDLTSEFASGESVSPPIHILPSISNDSSNMQEDELVDFNLHPFGMITENKKTVNNINLRQLEEEPEKIICFFPPETQAEPEGGYDAFYKYIAKNIKIPTEKYLAGCIKFYVQFTVKKDSSLNDFNTIKGDATILSEENLCVLKAAKWKAAKQRGIPVRQRIVMPIILKIS